MTIRENQVIKTILGRRSIRKFTADPVSPEIRDLLVECGFAAPSAHNRRPCVFIVIEDRKVLDDLAEAHDSGKMLRQAPLAIAVCAEKLSTTSPEKPPSNRTKQPISGFRQVLLIR